MNFGWSLWLTLLPLCSAAATAGLLVMLHPLLMRLTLVHPNARSSHKLPTPQGGGVAVAIVTVAAVAVIAALTVPTDRLSRLAAVLAATLLLTVVGALDDLRSLSARARLVAQFVAVTIAVGTLPADWQALPMLPWWLERALLVVGGVWFVNLVNFMDGIDWMTVAETVPIAGALALAGALGALPFEATIVALALGGAMLGFAPFNRPVARLFLGDVGSLPIALLLAWALMLLASRGHLAAALLLPLYYLADATLTLARRIARRERVWEAHRTHFYQRAIDRGFTAMDVSARVFAVNIGLAILALGTILWPALPVQVAAVAAGGLLVAWLLHRLTRGPDAVRPAQP